ncbi:hypothetical protein HNQ04_003845 [Deinococcus radiopugnans ATCC 19172]|uniref:Uncharacterized protein n=1 Tax=Deinococcus radiopugnans ATCC 19172 TaxID=585398 RepID=A0ABR6NYL1_9DEIO|nr:hypothetical protein [Deinococcus radiopugnans ATCC 19172]
MPPCSPSELYQSQLLVEIHSLSAICASPFGQKETAVLTNALRLTVVPAGEKLLGHGHMVGPVLGCGAVGLDVADQDAREQPSLNAPEARMAVVITGGTSSFKRNQRG